MSSRLKSSLLAIGVFFCLVSCGVRDEPKLNCDLRSNNLSEILYVNDMLIESGANGTVVGKEPEFDEWKAKLKERDYNSWSALKDIRKGTGEAKAEQFPSVFYAERRKTFPDIFKISNRIFVVSTRLKQILNTFDPETHHFFQ